MHLKLAAIRTSLLALAFISIAGFIHAADSTPYAKVEKNVSYKDAGAATVMDLYYPETGDAPYPTHIYIHGGGWTGGSKNFGGQQTKVFQQLAQQGFLGISVEYRLVNAKENRYMRTCAVDSMDALRYIFNHADELGVDTDNVFVWGGSAGGQLTLLCATAPLNSLVGENPAPASDVSVKAAVAWYPPTDMLNYEDISVEYNHHLRDLSHRIGRTVETDPVAFIEISPLAHLTQNDPPMLLIHGNKDTIVHLEHSRRFKAKADDLGVPCELVIVDNAGHVFKQSGAPISPEIDTICTETAQFFVDHVSLPTD